MRYRRGTMIVPKKILGGVMLFIGAGLILVPENIEPILCSYKLVFGIFLAISGYLLYIAGRRRR